MHRVMQAIVTFEALQPQLLQQCADIMAGAAKLPENACQLPNALAGARACISAQHAAEHTGVGQQDGSNAGSQMGQLLAPLVADAQSSVTAVLSVCVHCTHALCVCHLTDGCLMLTAP
jgi:hypothetical protein